MSRRRSPAWLKRVNVKGEWKMIRKEFLGLASCVAAIAMGVLTVGSLGNNGMTSVFLGDCQTTTGDIVDGPNTFVHSCASQPDDTLCFVCNSPAVSGKVGTKPMENGWIESDPHDCSKA